VLVASLLLTIRLVESAMMLGVGDEISIEFVSLTAAGGKCQVYRGLLRV